jgi:hypothetical protein
MKSHFYLPLLVLLVGFLILPSQQVQAQSASDTTNVIVGDTMYVAWQKTGGFPRTNALRSAILGDTAADGSRATLNRVYKLKVDGLYWESDDITNPGFHLRIVADPTSSVGAGHYPPVIQMTDTRDDGTTAALHLLTAAGDVTLKGIYISGRTTGNGSQTSYQPVVFNANNSTYIIDDCIFEYSNFSLVVFGGTNCVCVVTNNKFRNLTEAPPTQQWTGRGISIWADQQSVIIENNTFFNLGMVTFQMEGGSAKYLRYNHNTIINTGRGIMSNSGDWWQEAYFTNNLIINGWWEGEGYSDMHDAGRDVRQKHNGLFNIGPLPALYGPQQGRRVVVAKNAAYIDPAIVAKYGSPDTITRAWFMDPVSKLDYAIPYAKGGANDGHMYVADTMWLTSLPTGFANYLNDADWRKPLYNLTGATMLDSMFKFITQVRSGTGMYTTVFYHPTEDPAYQIWPLPESGVYTDAALMAAGTDGLPLGDLNWFPAKKAEFEIGKANFVKAIEDLAGDRKVFPVAATIEAEAATVGGTASVVSFGGFSYFHMGSGGFIQWDFDLAAGGVYSMNIWSHMLGQDTRGEHTLINGQEVHDVFGWGELIYTSTARTGDPVRGVGINLPNNQWNWYFYPDDSILAADVSKFVFVTGHNTIKITPSWGNQDFAGIDLIADGVTPPVGGTVTGANLIKSLRAPDATSAIVEPKGEGAPWVPSLFKSVKLGNAGSVTVNFTSVTPGNYHVRVFGQNPTAAAKTLTVKEGATTLTSPALPNKTDSTGVDIFSGMFSLTGGSHAIEVSGADVSIDYIQLVKDSVVTSVRPGNEVVGTFALHQNYPNPFNPTTTIQFTLGKPSNVQLNIYNVLGQKVATLINNQRMAAGPQTFQFDARNLASGVYFYRLEAGSFVSSKKMLLLK